MANPQTPTTAATTTPSNGAGVATDKPKRARGPKKEATLIGTLHRMETLLAPHTPAERSRILTFLNEPKA